MKKFIMVLILCCISSAAMATGTAKPSEIEMAIGTAKPSEIEMAIGTAKAATTSDDLAVAKSNNEKAAIELRAEAIKWQHKYYTELIRSIALEYTGLCFKDKRWIESNQQIIRINGEIQQLIKEKGK